LFTSPWDSEKCRNKATLSLLFSETGKQKQVFYIVAADVKALNPSLSRDTVTKALECALEKHSNFNTNA